MKNFFIGVILLISLYSCGDEENVAPPPFPVKPPTKVSKQVTIIYMAADNSLTDFAYANINQMEEAMSDEQANLIVYFDPQSPSPNSTNLSYNEKVEASRPRILRITKDNSPDIRSEIIKKYDEQNSADPKVMSDVINEIKKLYPADSYGLILWSHADAWLPPRQLRTRAIFEDKGFEMDIKDFAKALPPNSFDYLIFDACWLSSIEFLYEIKDISPYVLASPIEVLANGMPYKNIVPLLSEKISTEKKLKKIGYEFFNYYNTTYYEEKKKEANGNAIEESVVDAYQTAASALIKTSELEKLAKITNEVLSSVKIRKWEYNEGSVQRLYTFSNPRPLYDFVDFIRKNYPRDATAKIEEQVKKTVIYEIHTSKYLDAIPLKNISGISCYIPNYVGQYNDYYKTLNWTKESGFKYLFD